MLEKNILKYSPLEDKELVLLNLGMLPSLTISRVWIWKSHIPAARETGERVAKISSGLHGLKAKVHATEQDIRSIAF